jgi:hypothetical protein
MERRKRTQSAPRLRHLERDIIIGIEGNWRKARQYGETEQYSARKRVFLIKREPRKVFPPKYSVYMFIRSRHAAARGRLSSGVYNWV